MVHVFSPLVEVCCFMTTLGQNPSSVCTVLERNVLTRWLILLENRPDEVKIRNMSCDTSRLFHDPRWHMFLIEPHNQPKRLCLQTSNSHNNSLGAVCLYTHGRLFQTSAYMILSSCEDWLDISIGYNHCPSRHRPDFLSCRCTTSNFTLHGLPELTKQPEQASNEV